jgi:hypothetical protein
MLFQKLRSAEFGVYSKQHMYLQEFMENKLEIAGRKSERLQIVRII